MRDISFRGKSIETGEWVYGDISFNRRGVPHIRFWAGVEGVNRTYRVEAVDPDTVGQYTGLFAMRDLPNGDTECRFIYEGDIIEAKLGSGTYQGFSWGRQVVVFDRGAFCLRDRKGRLTPLVNYAPAVKFEVPGNIHDNPELLKE